MKLRLKYSIEYLSDTEVVFNVLKLDEKNIRNVQVKHPNNFDVIYLTEEQAKLGSHIWAITDNNFPDCPSGIVFLIPNKYTVSKFRNKKERDIAIKKAKEALNLWKVEAYY